MIGAGHTDVIAAAAALASCQLSGGRDDMALLLDDYADPRSEHRVELLLVAAAATELAADGLRIVARAAERDPAEMAAEIAAGYRERVGPDAPAAEVCDAVALSVAGQGAASATVLVAAETTHGELALAVAASLVLACVWRYRADIEGCQAQHIAQRIAVTAVAIG